LCRIKEEIEEEERAERIVQRIREEIENNLENTHRIFLLMAGISKWYTVPAT
jgi:hypothetical protein